MITATRQLLTAFAVLSAVTGANILPKEVRDYLATGNEKERELLDKLESALDKAAWVGKATGNWRNSELRPTFLPVFNISENIAQATFKELSIINNFNTKPKTKRAAVSMLSSKGGINDIADTISLETIREIYEAMNEADKTGRIEHAIYPDRSMYARFANGHKLPIPLGLGPEQRPIGKVFEESTPIEAGFRRFFQPGESANEDEERRKVQNAYDAKMQRKTMQHGGLDWKEFLDR
jgi:hypothetical protein